MNAHRISQMTVADARKALGDSIAIRSTGWGDYRVAPSIYSLRRRFDLTHSEATERAEALAYYSDDLPEAVATGLAMAADFERMAA